MSLTTKQHQALDVPLAQRLMRQALGFFKSDLLSASKKNEGLEYHAAAREQKGDAQFIDEVLLPTFAEQTELVLSPRAELKGYFANRLLGRIRKLRVALDEAHAMDDDEAAEDAQQLAIDELAEDMARVATMLTERAHHDGLAARELRPEETMLRVMRELTNAKEE